MSMVPGGWLSQRPRGRRGPAGPSMTRRARQDLLHQPHRLHRLAAAPAAASPPPVAQRRQADAHPRGGQLRLDLLRPDAAILDGQVQGGEENGPVRSACARSRPRSSDRAFSMNAEYHDDIGRPLLQRPGSMRPFAVGPRRTDGMMRRCRGRWSLFSPIPTTTRTGSPAPSRCTRTTRTFASYWSSRRTVAPETSAKVSRRPRTRSAPSGGSRIRRLGGRSVGRRTGTSGWATKTGR